MKVQVLLLLFFCNGSIPIAATVPNRPVDIPCLETSPFTDNVGRVHGNSPLRLSLASDPFPISIVQLAHFLQVPQ